jgi:uncharacterized protein (DUF58 family)
MVLTGRVGLLGLLAAVVAGGLTTAGLTPLRSLLAVNAVLAGLVVLDAARAARPRDLALVRRGDRKVRLGEVADVPLTVTHTGSRRWRGQLRDAWVPTAGARVRGRDTDRATLDLAPGQSVEVPMQVRPTRRGDRPTDRITLRSIGPLGLAGRQRSVRRAWSVRTLPPFTSRRHLPSRLARLRDMDGRQAIAVRAQGTEFDSLREYVPGDDVRSIDWRATARAADVMVRTWRPERDRHVVIVLDSGRTCAARIGDETRLDLAMDAALLLAALAGRAGDRVDLVAHDRRTRVQVSGGTGADLLPSLVDAMALLEPELAETDHRGLVAAVLTRVPKRALVVLLTSLDRAPFEEGLLPALPALTARHLVVVAAVREPDSRADAAATGTAAASAPASDDAAGAYARAAQAKGAVDRAHVTAQLSRLGARVVDADPGTLAPRLADTYLDLKAAGRL